MGQPRRRALGLLGVLVADVKLSELAAVRAIVATHAKYNQAHLLAVIDADIQHERACQPEPTLQSTEDESMLGPVQVKTGPAGNRTLTAKTV